MTSETEITSEMIEAAAREWWNSITSGGSWSSQNIGVKERYRHYAERALKAALTVTTDSTDKRARQRRNLTDPDEMAEYLVSAARAEIVRLNREYDQAKTKAKPRKRSTPPGVKENPGGKVRPKY